VTDELSELFVDYLLDFLVVVGFRVVTMLFLVVDKVINFVVLLAAEDKVRGFCLHVIEDAIDVHECVLVVRTSLNQRLSKELTSFDEGAVANVALPETKHLTYEVVFKEVHGREHIEHGLLLHPVRETQELGRWRHIVAFTALLALFLVLYLNNTLRTNRKVLTVKSLLVIDYDKIVGAVVSWGNRFAVTVKELDWHVCSMLCKERNSLVTCFDSLDHVPDGGVLANEVGLAQLSDLVVGRTLCVDDLFKVVIVEGFTVRGSGCFIFFFVVVLGIVELHAAGYWVAVHIILGLVHLASNAASLGATRPDWGELGCVDDTGARFAGDLVREHREGVLGQFFVGVKAVKLFVEGAILSLGLGKSNGEYVGLPS